MYSISKLGIGQTGHLSNIRKNRICDKMLQLFGLYDCEMSTICKSVIEYVLKLFTVAVFIISSEAQDLG